MPIVIDQMDIQPATSTPTRPAELQTDGAAAPTEQQKELDIARAVAVHHERQARVRVY